MTDRFIREGREEGVRILALMLPEQLESAEFDDLNEAVRRAIDGQPGASWVIDLTGVDYMGSTVLGLMVNIRQSVKLAGGRLALCGMSDRLTAVFRACSLQNLFTICATRPQAIRHLRD